MTTPTDSVRPDRALIATGSLSVASGGFQFKLHLTPQHFVADFPSFGMLLRGGRVKREFKKFLKDIPRPTPWQWQTGESRSTEFQLSLLKENCIYAAVKGRPVGKIRLQDCKLSIRPTPLKFFTKLV